MKNTTKTLTAEQILTWLNGRMPSLTVMHKGHAKVVWSPKDGTSIEDMVSAFIESEGINVEAEVEEGSKAAHVSDAMRQAAQEETGYDELTYMQVADALEECEGETTVALRSRLRKLEREFESKGGRGVALAEEMDTLRVAIAARGAMKNRRVA